MADGDPGRSIVVGVLCDGVGVDVTAVSGPVGLEPTTRGLKGRSSPAAHAPTRLHQPHEPPHRAPDSPSVDVFSRHEPCHAPADSTAGGTRRTGGCPPATCSGLVFADVVRLLVGRRQAELAVIRAVAHRKLGLIDSPHR